MKNLISDYKLRAYKGLNLLLIVAMVGNMLLPLGTAQAKPTANGRIGESANGRIGESANERMGESANERFAISQFQITPSSYPSFLDSLLSWLSPVPSPGIRLFFDDAPNEINWHGGNIPRRWFSTTCYTN